MQPDVILLDWYMPLLPADEWLKRYSEQEQVSIPVYIITSSVNPNDKQKAESFPIVKGFFSKPFKQHHIKEILDNQAKR